MEDEWVPPPQDTNSAAIHIRATSLPIPTPPRLSPDLSSSPAARFLSGFYSPATMSPMSPPRALSPEPDEAGVQVAGFVLDQEIGRGGFSVIRRATSVAGGSVVAVKIVRAPSSNNDEHAKERREQMAREVEIWTRLSHEHVLPLFSTHSTDRATYLVTEFCPAGSLFDILKAGKPSMDDAGMMFRQVVRGLRYLHDVARVVHGDMKLENVLVDEFGACKIADFGMARTISDSPDQSDSALDSSSDENEPVGTASSSFAATSTSARRQTIQGLSVHLSLMRPNRHARPSMPTRMLTTSQLKAARQHVQPGSLPYAAPELLMPVTSRRQRKHGHSGPGQDVWAVGVMLYVLLTGAFPFADAFEPRIRRKILAGTLSTHIYIRSSVLMRYALGAYEMPSGIGSAAVSVLDGCLRTDLRERWTARLVDETAWAVGWAELASQTPHHQPARSVSRPPLTTTSRSRSRATPTHHQQQQDAAGVGPIRTRTRSRMRRSASRDLGSSAPSSPEEDLVTQLQSGLALDERRGRSRRRPSHGASAHSRSPSLPATPPDDGLLRAVKFARHHAESSSSGSRKRPDGEGTKVA
jgi:MAP/microtubule affinity-regulating kinase